MYRDTCKRKIDALFDLRLSGEITPEEFSKNKEKLLEGKHKYEELINDTNKRVETWLDRAEKMLNFAETAKSRFELGNFDEKRDILATLGSNLALFNQILGFTVSQPVELVEEVAPDVGELHQRFEPTYLLETKQTYEDLYSQNEKWGRLIDESRVCEPQLVQLLARLYIRKRKRIEVSIDQPFPDEKIP